MTLLPLGRNEMLGPWPDTTRPPPTPPSRLDAF
jgi:hypothetical protein